MSVYLERMDDYILTKEQRPTPSQWQAISLSGCDILVSAAAGSGKTEVLSERISRKIAVNRWDINRVLVLTFTNAAAENMVSRIENKIEEKLTVTEKKEDIEFLKRQRLLMGEAQISTIDSFCVAVLRKFYYLVEENIKNRVRYLSPDFKVLVNNSNLLNSSINYVLEDFANQNSEMFSIFFYEHLDNYTDDIRGFLRNLYNKMLSIVNYREYIENELIKNIEYCLGNINYKTIYNLLEDIDVDNIHTKMHNIESAIKLYKQEVSKVGDISNLLTNLKDNGNIPIYNMSYLENIFNSYDMTEEIGNNKTATIEYLNNILQNIASYNKDDSILINNVYNQIVNIRNIAKTLYNAQVYIQCLRQLLLSIDDEFISRKRSNNYLDFSDLNHLTIKALEKKINGQKIVTEAALYYQNLFLEIYVDEYQDNNDLQEYILNLIRGTNNTFFRVGDVKQSIYGFRGSNSELFEEKYCAYNNISEYIADDIYDVSKDYKIDYSGNGICIILKENFRSDENILTTSNFVFNRLMYKNNAGISYELDNALYYPKVKPKKESLTPTYLISSNEKGVTDEQLAHNIAKEILYILENSNNELSFSDFAILFRERSDLVSKIKEIVEQYGISVDYREGDAFKNSHSFNIILNLLKFIDNQERDISLIVLLRSAIFNYSNDELLALSMRKGNSLFDKLSISTNSKDAHTINLLKKWINYSLNNSPLDTVKQVAMDTDFVEYLTTFDIDDLEVEYYENLLTIIFEASQNNSNLSYILEYLESITDGRIDIEGKQSANSVKFTTIHKSKGLEYKYVFLVGLDKNKNNNLIKSPIFSKELGITIKSEYANLTRLYNLNFNFVEKKNIEEEIRILYVAFTRAEKGLYLVSKNINLGKQFSKEINDKEQILSRVPEIKKYGDLVKIVLEYYEKETLANINNPTEQGAIFEYKELLKDLEAVDSNVPIDYSIFESVDKEELYFDETIKNVEQKIYPTKTSYSALKNSDKIIKSKTKSKEYLKLKNLVKNNNAILRGNIVHKLFERLVLDIKSGITIENLTSYLESMVQVDNVIFNVKEKRILTREEFEFINNDNDLDFINKFVENKDIINFINNAVDIETEITFTTYISNDDIESIKNNKIANFEINNDKNSNTILQGVVDLLIKVDEYNYIVVDYKTDNLKLEKDFIDRHKNQLLVYSNAVKNFYGNDINVDKYVYSYVLGKLIKV